MDSRTLVLDLSTLTLKKIFGLAAFIVGYLWTFIVNIFLGVMVWLVIWLAMLSLIALTICIICYIIDLVMLLIVVWIVSKFAEKDLNPNPDLRLKEDELLVQLLSYSVNALLIVDTTVFVSVYALLAVTLTSYRFCF